MTQEHVIGFIAAPTGAGRAWAQGHPWGFRGRAPRWYATKAAALAACRAIERAGHRDGGRGRDCYIVSLVRTAQGVQARSGGEEGGLYLDANTTITVGATNHVEDAVMWLNQRPRRWLLAHGLG